MGSERSEIILQSPLGSLTPTFSTPNIQWVLPVHLNGDGITDFIVNYWQAAPSPGFVLTEPTRDALFAYVSQADGSYKIDNLGVFGVADPKLGGASRKVDTGDINGDGIDDFAFAMNSEDGRAAEDVNTNEARPAVLLSQPGGKFSIVNLGQAAWGHSVALIDNGLGTKDILFAGYTDPGLQAFRYLKGDFSDVTQQFSAPSQGWATAVKAVPSASPTAAAAYLIGTDTQGEMVNGRYQINKNGLALYAKSASGWSIVDAFYNEAVFSTSWISWQRSENVGISVYRIDGKFYFHGTFDEVIISDEVNADGSITVIGKMMLGRYTKSDIIVQGEKYDERDVQPENHLRIFKLKDGHLIEQPGAIIGQKVDVNFNDFSLTDINGDGAKDIVVQAMTRPWVPSLATNAGKPIIYINDGTGTYHYADIAAFPKNRDGVPPGPELWGYFHDVDGDGFVDLVTWRSDVAEGGSNIQINLLSERPGLANSAEDDILFGTTGADQILAGLGNDTINGGAGLDEVVFDTPFAEAQIKVAGGSLIVSTPKSGADTLINVERVRFSDQTLNATSLMRDLSGTAFSLVTETGFRGSVGGSGNIIGTAGVQDISLINRFGNITLDPSFNAGGDVIRLDGKAENWTVQRTGSSAKLISDMMTVTIPIGTKASWIVFADGARPLAYQDGSFKLGSQSFSETAAPITSPAQTLPAVAPSAEAKARMILSEGADIAVGGDVQVIGTSRGKENVEVLGGKVSFDPSFNTGGDIIDLPGNTGSWTATRSGSSMVFNKGSDNITLPIGTTGTTIAFDNSSRSLVYANGQFTIGSQIIESAGATTLFG